MASRKEYLGLARALTVAYPEHLAPQKQDGLISVEELLAIPEVHQAMSDPAKLAHMLRVVAQLTTRLWFSGSTPGASAPLKIRAFNPPPYWVPGCNYQLSLPDDYRIALIVETHLELGEDEVLSAKRHMADHGSQFGLLFDVERTLVLRDSLEGDVESGIEIVHSLDTATVLSRMAPINRSSLDDDVGRWLQRLTASWSEAIPRDADKNVVSSLLEDIAPAAFGTHIVRTHLAA